ncbi:MAG: hypothetical protein GY951_12820 [Psychromonas sp.]|nr:hypothetical protein [Psychromonas sp.]
MIKLIFIILPFLMISDAFAQKTIVPIATNETYQIGLMVQELQSALQARDEQALETIRLYGTDSRYYSMIRGWLFQELVAVESQLHGAKNKKSAQKFQDRSNFLKKAIILVDLE